MHSNGEWAISTRPGYQLFNFHDTSKEQGHLTRLIGESELQKLGARVGVRCQCVREGEAESGSGEFSLGTSICYSMDFTDRDQ